MLYAFAVAHKSPLHCMAAYFVGFCCDELDGRFARMFQQTSRFGAVLDMVTDRISTTGLLALLCLYAPNYCTGWISLICLDLASHWFQMYASLVCGEVSHKDAKSKNPIISLYYRNRIFMGFCCVSCEVLYLCIFALCHPGMPSLTAPALPAIGSALSLITGSTDPARHADSIVAALTVFSLPGVLVKQVVNMNQLKASMDKLVKFEKKVP